jgi:hypothetical protein
MEKKKSEYLNLERQNKSISGVIGVEELLYLSPTIL